MRCCGFDRYLSAGSGDESLFLTSIDLWSLG
jgi:hypothetical protein